MRRRLQQLVAAALTLLVLLTMTPLAQAGPEKTGEVVLTDMLAERLPARGKRVVAIGSGSSDSFNGLA